MDTVSIKHIPHLGSIVSWKLYPYFELQKDWVKSQAQRAESRNLAMSEYKVVIHWKRSGPDFLKGQYSRAHSWSFDNGMTLPASAAPSLVPAPWSHPANVDPEEAFVAAISSCHMLTYIYLASQHGFVVENYRDEAVGILTANDKGALWMSSVTLNVKVNYEGEKLPMLEEEMELHHLAHGQCYLANSVKTKITVRPNPTSSPFFPP